MRRCSIQLKIHQCIVVKPDRALRYKNQAAKHDSQPVFSVLAPYLQKAATESYQVPVHCLYHFTSIIAKYSCPAELAKAHEAVEIPVNQLVWHIIHRNQLHGSAIFLSKYTCSLSLAFRFHIGIA